MFAIAQAVTVRMGHLLGAKESHAAEKVSYIGICIVIILMSVVAIFYWLFPNILISVDFDIHNPSNFIIISEIKKILIYCAIFQIIEAVRIILFGSLRGLKDTKFTLLTSIVSFWCIALPIGYMLGIYLQLGGVGFWCGMIMGAGLSVILLQWRFKWRLKRYQKIGSM